MAEAVRRTVAAATVVSLVDGVDLSLLAVSFKAWEQELHFAPDRLGQILLFGGLASSLSSIFWGSLADRLDKRTLLFSTTASLGVVTLGTSQINTFHEIVVMQMLASFLVASVTPVTQSLISQTVEASSRGAAFSLLATCSALSVSGAAALTSFLHWRTAYSVMGGMTIALSVLIHQLLPAMSPEGKGRVPHREVFGIVACELDKVKAIFSIPTFLMLLFGGIVGCIPWNALHFFMMYLQSAGFTTQSAASLIGCLSFGKIFGSLLGGHLGDFMASRWPQHGRAFVGQLSIVLGMASLSTVFIGLSRSDPSFQAYAAGIFLFGVTSVWCNPGVDRPLWAELVAPDCRGKVVAWWSAVAASFGSVFGGPLVGWMSVTWLGYHPSSGSSASNADALATALLLCTMIPWALCFLFYSAIHLTYPADQERQATVHSGSSLLKAKF